MRLYAYEINTFIDFLFHLKLAGTKSRMRSRFLTLLAEYSKRHESEINKLLHEYADKDEQGQLIQIQENNSTRYSIANMEQFDQEYQELAREEIVLDLTAERQIMLETVRDAVLECEDIFEGNEAIRYNRWCDIVEGIQYKP